MKNYLLISVMSFSAVSAVAAVDRSDIFEPCMDSERIRLAEKFPTEYAEQVRSSLSEKWIGPRLFELGYNLNSINLPEAKEIGLFLRARSYLREGLVHIAYEQFLEILRRPLVDMEPTLARVAAVGCLTHIQKRYPSFGYQPQDSAAIRSLLGRPELTSLERRTLGRALVIRMKELMSRWDDKEVELVSNALKLMPDYYQYTSAMIYQRRGMVSQALPLWEKIIEKGQMPKDFKDDQDHVILMYSRTLFEQGKFQKSGEILRTIPRDSNYLAQALQDLSWALLLSNKQPEAIGTAFNLQKSLLTRVYAPEAPLVASIALFEMCQYARALKNAVFFKKKYYPLILWFKKLTPEQQAKPYRMLVKSLRRQGGVPNVVLLEWLRSPEYRAIQEEANLLFEERKLTYQQYAKRLEFKKGSTWVKDWKRPMPVFYSQVEKSQRTMGKRLDDTLAYLTKKMVFHVVRMVENVQLLEIEIYDAAGEDMVWRNANVDYQKWLDKQEPETRAKDKFWEWGNIPVDPRSKDEVWEDELGFTVGNVSNDCQMKAKYRAMRASR